MRKLRWLAVALAVMAAPAVWVFASDMYFLGFSEDEKRKDVLAREIGWNSLRSEVGGAIWSDFSSERERVVPEISLHIVRQEPSLWHGAFECGTRRIELAETDELPEADRNNARAVIDSSQNWTRFNQWIHPFSNRAKARSFSNFELAAINTCFRATPLHDTCAGYWFDDRVSDEDVADLLVEQGVMELTEEGYCWGLADC